MIINGRRHRHYYEHTTQGLHLEDPEPQVAATLDVTWTEQSDVEVCLLV